VGSILGLVVLSYGLWTKSFHTQISAYILYILSSVGSIISYVTGEAAEDTVERVGGISESLIERHEEFAFISLIALLMLGIMSLISMIMTFKKSPNVKTIATITLLISIISFGIIAWTGYLGGRIRHTEIDIQTATVQKLIVTNTL
jgi:uncharacterized membrane protein